MNDINAGPRPLLVAALAALSAAAAGQQAEPPPAQPTATDAAPPAEAEEGVASLDELRKTVVYAITSTSEKSISIRPSIVQSFFADRAH